MPTRSEQAGLQHTPDFFICTKCEAAGVALVTPLGPRCPLPHRLDCFKLRTSTTTTTGQAGLGKRKLCQLVLHVHILKIFTDVAGEPGMLSRHRHCDRPTTSHWWVKEFVQAPWAESLLVSGMAGLFWDTEG